MSQNPPETSGSEPQRPAKEWWESEEFDDAGYVPGQGAVNASPAAGQSGDPATEQPSDQASDPAEGQAKAAEADQAKAAQRAAREEASAPATQAVPVIAPAEPSADTTVLAPPAPEAKTVALDSLTATSAPAAAPAPPSVGPPTAALPSDAPAAPGRGRRAADVPADGAPSEESLRAALSSKPVFPRVLQWVIAILTPFILLAGAVRAVASGAFLWLEYHRPGFPADSFGFDTAQRMVYGSYGVDYINNFAGRDYLGGLVVPSGVRTLGEPSLFRPEEVGHMADVQALVHLLYLLGAVSLVVVIIACLILRVRWAGGVRRSLFAGAGVTLGLAAVLGVLGVLGWERFFTGFHQLFFSQGNWEFFLDDTLIRLYPPQFWVDAAIVLGALVLITCLVTLVLTWPTKARRERSKIKQSQRDFRLD